jgi:hypothetical protein
MTSKFALGVIQITPSASQLLLATKTDAVHLLNRHVRGDYGEFLLYCERLQNENSITTQGSIVSIYHTIANINHHYGTVSDAVKVAVVTGKNWDRTAVMTIPEFRKLSPAGWTGEDITAINEEALKKPSSMRRIIFETRK